MHAAVLMTLALAAGADPATADSAAAVFEKAASVAKTDPRLARRLFGEAAGLYEKLLQQGAQNPQLYRNLGNAHFLAADPDDAQGDHLARAILAYRRGLELDPSDPHLQENLEHARRLVNFPPPGTFGQPSLDDRPPWLPRLPALWFGLAAAGYLAAALGVARWWMVRRRAWLSAAAGCVVLALAFAAAGGIELWHMDQQARYPVVVVARDGVQLLTGNGSRYPPRYETMLNRGVEARLRYERGRWLQVELGGGEIGWVPRAVVLPKE